MLNKYILKAGKPHLLTDSDTLEGAAQAEISFLQTACALKDREILRLEEELIALRKHLDLPATDVNIHIWEDTIDISTVKVPIWGIA